MQKKEIKEFVKQIIGRAEPVNKAMQNGQHVSVVSSDNQPHKVEKVSVAGDSHAPEQAKKKEVVSLSHKQYLKVTDFMRCKEEQIREVPFTKEEIVKFISDGVGFPVSHFSIVDAAEATGIHWKKKVKTRHDANPKSRLSSSSAIRNVAFAVAYLYKQLGVEPTDGLKTVYKQFCEDEGYVPIEEIKIK